MRFLPTALPGVIVVEPVVHADARGFFMEAYRRETFHAAGIAVEFLQDNHSWSRRGVIRGLHLQLRPPQAKLVRVVHGAVWDVVADVRAGSPTFGQHVALELSGGNRRQVFVPPGYAHGLQVLTDEAHVLYKVDAYYDAGGEVAVRWDDPILALPWPIAHPVLSDKDRTAPGVDALQARFR
jgi:dTDP-4-dehydrorhamnose 3,5-epimerase